MEEVDAITSKLSEMREEIEYSSLLSVGNARKVPKNLGLNQLILKYLNIFLQSGYFTKYLNKPEVIIIYMRL